jgi:predicted Zn-dependent protease
LIENDVFYTRTMAKVYADQGDLKNAERIYKHLLAQEPGKRDLAEALSEIKKQRVGKSPDALSALFDQWIGLILLHRNVEKLLNFKQLLKNSR